MTRRDRKRGRGAIRVALSAVAAAVWLAGMPAPAQTDTRCSLEAVGGGAYSGLCRDAEIGEALLSLWSPHDGSETRRGHWRGELTLTDEGEEYGIPLCVDSAVDRTVIHDPRGWFEAERFELVDGRLELAWEIGGTVPPGATDVAVLRRALELLDGPARWHGEDDRECEDDESAGRRSLYCALHRASVEVTGEYEHRRPAIQEVRYVIDDVTGGGLEHRLRDFNNSASFEEVRGVLETALTRSSN